MRVLLINPRFPESFWSFKWAVDTVLPGQRALNPPLGLATIAALCPEDWDVQIVDENVESIPLTPQADIIGICGMGVQFQRQQELLTYYRNKGYFVVAGGSYASLCPESYDAIADCVVTGEAEYTWREFCDDFRAGRPKPRYQETGLVAMADSPVPRYDLLKLNRYRSVSVQFSRGCPYRCEFCDIIVMFGRRPRTKALSQIGSELDLLRKLRVRNAFFVDDNLIGNKRAAKDLLRFLEQYQRQHDYRFRFGTEASVNLAQDDELMELFRRAGFAWVFLGIESPDVKSLQETKKFQNTRQDMLSAVRRLYANGIEVFGGFIVGFDNDTADTFEQQYRFITQSGIQGAMVGLLTAPPKTPLYYRLEKEGRLLPKANDSDNTKQGTNVIPLRMKYEEMIERYRGLCTRLMAYRNIADRIRNKVRFIRTPPAAGNDSWIARIRIIRRLLFRGLLPGGVPRMFHFLRSMPFHRPRFIPLAVQDWIVGLSMRDYVERHYGKRVGELRSVARHHLDRIERSFRRYVQRGALEVSWVGTKDAVSNLSVSMRGWLDRRFFTRAGHHFERVLEHTTASITLRIDALNDAHRRHLRRLLKRLARYGDRVSIAVHGEIRDTIEVDSSVFNVILDH
ncbi:MAG: B12-binding domain-containing radical SAM protein [Gemmatimonadota bacterium]|nr:B12-binding domain-containing radical SAM protein [Gemmatimonadota bacterium]